MNIPHPENPFHIDNLRTIPLLEAQDFQGTDVSLEHSLFDYNLVWRHLPEDLRDHPAEDYVFVFNVGRVNGTEHEQFARVGMSSSEFDSDTSWMKPEDWASMMSAHGTTFDEWMQLPYPQRIYDLYGYWGWMNIFGSTVYGGAFDIRDPQHDYGSSPMPGESPDDYYTRLVSGEPDRGAPWIPLDFIRTETGAWFVSPDFGNWLCHWHNGMDRVYAAGSTVIANREVPLSVIEDAIERMELNYIDKVQSGEIYDAVEAQVLIEVMRDAYNAEPSEEPQTAQL